MLSVASMSPHRTVTKSIAVEQAIRQFARVGDLFASHHPQQVFAGMQHARHLGNVNRPLLPFKVCTRRNSSLIASGSSGASSSCISFWPMPWENSWDSERNCSSSGIH
jgi:hypothetical protein